MKLRATSVAWLLLFALTACHHKVPRQQVPTAPPVNAAPQPPPPEAVHPSSEGTSSSKPSGTTVKARRKPNPSIKQKQQASSSAQQPAPAGASSQNTNQSPAVSAIGQLSSGSSSVLSKETEDSIAAVERNLNGIARKFSSQEQKTAVQIREYLKQAKAALASGDTDGAHTLTAKAKVLLHEISIQSK